MISYNVCLFFLPFDRNSWNLIQLHEHRMCCSEHSVKAEENWGAAKFILIGGFPTIFVPTNWWVISQKSATI